MGLFSFENDGVGHEALLQYLHESAKGSLRRLTHCVALGTSLFARYWYCPPEQPRRPADIFRAYNLEGMAPAYFIHNVVEALCERSVLDNNDIWYPAQGKEAFTLGQIALKRE